MVGGPPVPVFYGCAFEKRSLSCLYFSFMSHMEHFTADSSGTKYMLSPPPPRNSVSYSFTQFCTI